MAKKEFNRPVFGSVFMLLGIAMLIYDSTKEWDTIWATAIGLKLILIGIVFLVWDPLKRLDERQKKKDGL